MPFIAIGQRKIPMGCREDRIDPDRCLPGGNRLFVLPGPIPKIPEIVKSLIVVRVLFQGSLQQDHFLHPVREAVVRLAFHRLRIIEPDGPCIA
jgi:hypothetical protein